MFLQQITVIRQTETSISTVEPSLKPMETLPVSAENLLRPPITFRQRANLRPNLQRTFVNARNLAPTCGELSSTRETLPQLAANFRQRAKRFRYDFYSYIIFTNKQILKSYELNFINCFAEQVSKRDALRSYVHLSR
jgi:hypothetical protein